MHILTPYQVENPFEDVESTATKPLIKRILGGAVTGVGFLSDAFDLYASAHTRNDCSNVLISCTSAH